MDDTEYIIDGYDSVSNIGVAVFKEDTLVGELSSLETLAFLATINEVSGFLISIPDPNDTSSLIDVYLTPLTNSNINSSIVNGTPYVEISYAFSGNIYSASSTSNYLDNSVLEEISVSCNNYLENLFTNYLYKTSKELDSDINNIGQTFRYNFLTLTDFNDFDWTTKYSDTFFSVDVSTEVRSRILTYTIKGDFLK